MVTLHHVGPAGGSGEPGRFGCPFCRAFEVDRLYVATLGADSCECRACGGRWDEARDTGRRLGPADGSSVLAPRRK